jgi:adenylate cyclase class IV
MPRNVEVKVSLINHRAALRAARRICRRPPRVIRQCDTFYDAGRGRLKLREQVPGSLELIHYFRPDRPGAKLSNYRIMRIPGRMKEEVKAFLAALFREDVRVRKTRYLWIHQGTRLHVDRVAGLGWFLELEAVLKARETPGSGHRRAEDLLRMLGLGGARPVSVAYADLLRKRRVRG